MEVIKISNMTGKLKGFRAISTNTLTNQFCVDMFNRKDKDLICTECYSAKNLQGMRKNCVSSRQHNSEIWWHYPAAYVAHVARCIHTDFSRLRIDQPDALGKHPQYRAAQSALCLGCLDKAKRPYQQVLPDAHQTGQHDLDF